MPVERIPLEQESFIGMRDSVDPSTAEPRKAQVLQNVYPQEAELGGGCVGRPGFDGLPATPSQLGSPGARRGQRSYTFTTLAGVNHTVVFVGGELWEYNWGSDTFTDRSTNQPTTSTTGEIYVTTFADELIVTDGVNQPWSWDGSGSGAGTFTTITGIGAACFGPPAVYYAKLFFILEATRSDIVWSEENQINTGYNAGTFDNVWTLGQTDQKPLFCLKATNEALYYFREDSIGKISGRVTPEFRADGTREGVSENIGTSSPDSVIVDGLNIWFFDSNSRLYKIPPGGEPEAHWKDMRELANDLPDAGRTNISATYYPQPRLLLFGVQESGASENSAVITVNRETEEYAGIWRGFPFTALDLVEADTGEDFLFHLTEDGYVYQHGNPGGTKWNDNFQDTPAPITHIIRGTPLAHNKRLELHFDRAHIIHRTPAPMTDIGFNLITPAGGLQSLPTYSITGGTSLWDQMIWDTDVWSVPSGESKVSIGVSARGRWCQPEISHAVTDEEFGFIGWDIEAYPMTEEPEAA